MLVLRKETQVLHPHNVLQRLRDCQRHVYDFGTLVMQWYSSGTVFLAHTSVSLVIRDAKLAACETNMGQKDMGFLGFLVSHY